MTKRFFLALAGAAICASLVCGQQPQLTPEQKQQIEAAIPKKAPAKPRKGRRLLVTNLAKNGDRVIRGHAAIPGGNYAIELMGKQTGAFEAVFSDDVEMFRPDKLKQFDAVVFNNTQGVLFTDPELRSLLDFITEGHGFVGITPPSPRSSSTPSTISGQPSARCSAARKTAAIPGPPPIPSPSRWMIPRARSPPSSRAPAFRSPTK
jgi:hypothetical protein